MGACHLLSVLVVTLLLPFFAFANLHLKWLSTFFLQLSATDVPARTTMKGAAKCDKHRELQDSVNQSGFERTQRFRDIRESMPASVSTFFMPATSSTSVVPLLGCVRVLKCLAAFDAFGAWGFLLSAQLAKRH